MSSSSNRHYWEYRTQRGHFRTDAFGQNQFFSGRHDDNGQDLQSQDDTESARGVSLSHITVANDSSSLPSSLDSATTGSSTHRRDSSLPSSSDRYTTSSPVPHTVRSSEFHLSPANNSYSSGSSENGITSSTRTPPRVRALRSNGSSSTGGTTSRRDTPSASNTPPRRFHSVATSFPTPFHGSSPSPRPRHSGSEESRDDLQSEHGTTDVSDDSPSQSAGE
ncbi:hypothetical protein BaRGS_00040326 [Batillaria attramentaria]|uniref:Uncharacterized protein n=1 Tax=Batillaria attramentaria TaxID=370345 RepID=A0ABD0J0M0_9CAEN